MKKATFLKFLFVFAVGFVSCLQMMIENTATAKKTNAKVPVLDSMFMNVGPFSIQTRDAEFTGSWVRANCETLFDSIKGDYRRGQVPNGSPTFSIVTDSAEVADLLSLYGYVKSVTAGEGGAVNTRVSSSIRLHNSNQYLKARLDAIDSAYQNNRKDKISVGEFLYRRPRN